jgi:predicted dehydrogenase
VVRLGVIGCGHWGPNHIRVFSTLPESTVVAAADPDEGSLARVAALHPHVRSERDYHALLSDSDIDAVVVATPTGTHAQIVREAIEAGKHVLCEKPLCETAEQGEALAAIARERERVVMVGHVFLFNPGIMRVNELVQAGDLGSLRYLTAVRTNLGPIRNDVNASYDLAAHDIAIFNWIVGGEPDVVSATGASFISPELEDVAMISMKYEEVLATIHVSWLNPKKVRQITVVGAKQMVTWDDLDPSTPVAIYDKGAQVEQDYGDFGEYLRLAMWDGDVRLPKVPFGEPLKQQASAFLEYVRDGRADRSDLDFSVGVVRVLEAINASMADEGRPINVNGRVLR